MFTEMKRRSYTLKKRADSREETRARIVAATMALHEELGPKETTISAVAERAGVQRLTVYRHFPDETALFRACTSQWLVENPPPDPSSWAALEGEAKTREALASLYRYYRRTERMWVVSYRDETEVEALRQPMREVRNYLGRIAADLAGALDATGRAGGPIAVTLAHAVQFATWQSLKEQGASDAAMVELVMDWLTGVRD